MSNFEEAHYVENTSLALEKPIDPIAQAVASSEDFDRLKARLLDRKRHMYVINGKDAVNKSGWQKIAGALGIKNEIISKNHLGHTGALREVLQDAKGKTIISFSITVRASSGDRVQERTGRCDSSESKHNQYEHKMESVAHTRAFNAAICAIVGGEPGDNADDMQDIMDTSQRSPDGGKGRFQVPTSELIALYAAKGSPGESLGAWVRERVPTYKPGTKLTPAQSLLIHELLSAL